MNFFATITLMMMIAAGFSACSDGQDQQPSQLNDFVVRGEHDTVVFYADEKRVYKRYCNLEDLAPSRRCSQSSTADKKTLPSEKAILKEILLAKLGQNVEVPEKYLRNNGQELLRIEIATTEGFLNDPEISEVERKEAKAHLAKLKSYKSSMDMGQAILSQLFSQDVTESVPFSAPFKQLDKLFGTLGPDIMIFDSASNLWWHYMGQQFRQVALSRTHRPVAQGEHICDPYHAKPASLANWKTLQSNEAVFADVLDLRGYRGTDILSTWTSDILSGASQNALAIGPHYQRIYYSINLREDMYCVSTGSSTP